MARKKKDETQEDIYVDGGQTREYTEREVWENPKKNLPDCCRACGNPAYPRCTMSCPIFDD